MSEVSLDQINPLVVRTPEQIAALREYALNNGLPENIYEDFSIYANYMVPKIKVGKKYYDYEWFHWWICENWNKAIFEDGTLLTIEVGPQIGKSILTALAITFIHGVSPDSSIIYATYNETKAVDFTKRYIFKFMSDNKYKLIFPHIALKYELDKKDSSSEGSSQRKISTMKDTEYTLSNTYTKKNYMGGYRCFGLDQGIHGLPGDIFIIDDYVDNGDSVKSENFRAKRREWFYNDMSSRLQDNSSIIVALCTRWYFDDIIGLLHESYYADVIPDCEAVGIIPPKLNKIKIRAEYRETDDNPPCDPRKVNGEKLWRVHTLKYSLAKRGMYFNAMHNCDPTDTDSVKQVKAEDFGYYEPKELPSAYSLDIMIDGASTTGARSDHTSIEIWKRSGDDRYLVHLIYEKWEIPDLIAYVIDLISSPDYCNYGELLIEFANSGQALYQFLTKAGFRCTALNFNSRPIGETVTKTDKALNMTNKGRSKEDRFYRCIPVIIRPNKPIKLPKNPIKHQDEFIRQVISFTGEPGKKDDFVDGLSHYINYTENGIIKASKYEAHIAIEGYSIPIGSDGYYYESIYA